MSFSASIILPVFNCNEEFAAYFPLFCAFLKKNVPNTEIIVVDDHSDSGKIFSDSCASYGAKYLRNDKNYGKGYSVKKGFELATGDWLLFMDGDFPFDFSVINAIVDTIQTKNPGMVIGDRTRPGSSYSSKLPLIRKAGSKVLSALSNMYFAKGFTDTQCGIKAFRKNIAKDIFGQLTQHRFSFDLEVLFLATSKKLQIERVPVQVREQHSSTVRMFRDSAFTTYSLLCIFFNKITGRYRIS